MTIENHLGFIKYHGSLVEDGLMDGRRQAQALIGFDHALRFFIEERLPIAHNIDFEIPIRIREGSWEALIPQSVADWMQTGLGIAVATYLAKAAQTLASNDFKEVNSRDLFRQALEGMQWFAKMGKHIGDVSIRQFTRVEFQDGGALVGIPNSEGEILYVPKYFLDLYVKCPPLLLDRIVENVEAGRELIIGATIDGEASEVSIDARDKSIFCRKSDDTENDFLFPELEHGQRVELDGEVTRENKTSNSLGFKYRNHILTSYPESGNIVPYKPFLFLKCRLYGRVDRIDDKGRVGARRPKLHFDRLEPQNEQLDGGLF